MAMVKCLECKKSISDDAEKCPHCGTENTTSFKMWYNGIIGFFVLYVIAKWYFDFDTNYLWFY